MVWRVLSQILSNITAKFTKEQTNKQNKNHLIPNAIPGWNDKLDHKQKKKLQSQDSPLNPVTKPCAGLFPMGKNGYEQGIVKDTKSKDNTTNVQISPQCNPSKVFLDTFFELQLTAHGFNIR